MITLKRFISVAALPMTILGNSFGNLMAKESKEFYLTVNYGSSAIKEADWKATISDINYKGKINFKEGSGWEAGLGYDFGKIRTELTFSEFNNEVTATNAQLNEGINKGLEVVSSATGDFKFNNLFINNYLELPIGKKKKFIPYIGGGIGASILKIENIIVAGEKLDSANTWLFGYSWKFGLNYFISQNLGIFGEGNSTGFNDFGIAGKKNGLDINSEIGYRGGFLIYF